MSMDLYLWKAPVIDDAGQARRLIDRYFDDSDKSVFEASADVPAMAAKLRAIYSDDPDAIADEACHWASLPFEETDRLLVLNIRWGADNAVLDQIIALARDHDLVVYDPQGPDVYRARELPEEAEPVPPTTLADVLKSFVMVAGLAALTYGAWLIPIGWISWPAVIVLAFLTAAAFMVFYLLLASRFGWISDDEKPKRR